MRVDEIDYSLDSFGHRRRFRIEIMRSGHCHVGDGFVDLEELETLRGELPAHKVYEDDKAFAFLDIMPRAPGHTLVIPKAEARTFLDIKADDLAYLMGATQGRATAAPPRPAAHKTRPRG